MTMRATTLQIPFGDERRTVTVHADGRIVVDDASFTIDAVAPGVYRVSNGTGRRTVAVAGPADARWVSVDGQVFVLDVSGEPASRTRARGAAQGSLTAPMPATVVKLLVAAGDTVAEGDTLMVLEAMKMELPIRAPRDGRIGAVHCRVGELVQPGVPLLELA